MNLCKFIATASFVKCVNLDVVTAYYKQCGGSCAAQQKVCAVTALCVRSCVHTIIISITLGCQGQSAGNTIIYLFPVVMRLWIYRTSERVFHWTDIPHHIRGVVWHGCWAVCENVIGRCVGHVDRFATRGSDTKLTSLSQYSFYRAIWIKLKKKFLNFLSATLINISNHNRMRSNNSNIFCSYVVVVWSWNQKSVRLGGWVPCPPVSSSRA
jgi:hypothetical protein